MIQLLLEITAFFVIINGVLWLFGAPMDRLITVYVYLTAVFVVLYCIGLVIGLGIKTVTGL
jgi:hypothetical protein